MAEVTVNVPEAPPTFDIVDLTADEFGYIIACMGRAYGNQQELFIPLSDALTGEAAEAYKRYYDTLTFSQPF